ncbi:hypothetical protein ABTE76_18990, partial [Acinetobacter baumannii]
MHLVDAAASNSMVVSEDKPKLGMRSQSTNDVVFKEHALPAESVLSAGSATVQDQIQFAMDIAKVVMSGAAVGLSEGAL